MHKIISQLKQGKKFLSFMGFKTLAQVLIFIIPLIVAKFLSPDLFGSFSLFKMLLFFGSTLFIGPILTPFNIESNKEYAQTKKANTTFTSALIYTLCSLAVFLTVFALFGKELIQFTGLNYEEYKWVFIFAFLGLFTKNFFGAFFMGQDNKKAHVLVEVMYGIGLLVYLFIILQVGLFNLYNILWAYAVAAVLVIIISVPLINYDRIFPLKFSRKNLKTLTHFAGWVMLGYTSSYFINWGDNLVLKYFVSLEEIGVYNLAYQFFKGFIMVSLMINTYFTPFVSQNIGNKEKLRNYYYNKRPKILLFAVIALFLASILIYNLINLLYIEYIESILIVNLLSLGALCAFYYSFLIPIFNSSGFYKVTQLLLIFQILINLVLDIFLIPLLGILGAAIATTVAYFIFTVLYVVYFRAKIIKNLI